MNYMKSLLQLSNKSSSIKSLLKVVVPKKVYNGIVNYINKDNKIRIYTNNRTVTIDSKVKNPNGFALVAYWDGKPNFGDLVGPYLISTITNRPVLNIINESYSGFVTVGSILQSIDREDMIVWGSGFIEEPSEKALNNIKKYNPLILCLRGKKTTECLIKANIKLPDNVVYGDPALILPFFYQPSINYHKSIGICPHFIHKSNFLEIVNKDDNLNVIDVQKDMESVVSEIASSSVCISTSLHGLIIAQAYNIPWIWLEIYDQNLFGNDFKFKDFFSTLKEEQVVHIKVKLEDIKNLDYVALAKQASLPEKLYNEELILRSLKEYLNNNYEKNR